MSLYQKLPDDLLVQFYYEIRKNMNRGVLTNAMYHELDLIKIEARKRGILLPNFYRYDE